VINSQTKTINCSHFIYMYMKLIKSSGALIVLLTLAVAPIPKDNTTLFTAQTEIVIGTFDGYDEEDGYAFIITDVNGEENMMYFQNITSEALSTTNLKSEDFVGQRFRISFTISEEIVEEDGFEETYEVYTIIKLEKL
jgi:hypothetical protein